MQSKIKRMQLSHSLSSWSNYVIWLRAWFSLRLVVPLLSDIKNGRICTTTATPDLLYNLNWSCKNLSLSFSNFRLYLKLLYYKPLREYMCQSRFGASSILVMIFSELLRFLSIFIPSIYCNIWLVRNFS